MICARCDKPILPGEPYDRIDKFSTSGAGTTLYLHRRLCAQPPTQNTQAPIRH